MISESPFNLIEPLESTPRTKSSYRQQFKEEAIIIADTREQQPYAFPGGYTVMRKALPTGDYSLLYHENTVAVERKSLPDYIHSITQERTRFMKEIERMSQEVYFTAIVVEGSWRDIVLGNYPRSMTVSSDVISGTTLSIQTDYDVPVMWLEDRQAAQIWTLRFLERVWRRVRK